MKVIFQAFWRFVWMYAILLNISKMPTIYFSVTSNDDGPMLSRLVRTVGMK